MRLFCVIMNITFAFKRTRTFGFYMNTNLSNQPNFFRLDLSRKKLQLLVIKTNTNNSNQPNFFRKPFTQETQAAEPRGLIRVIWIIRVRKTSSSSWFKSRVLNQLQQLWLKTDCTNEPFGLCSL